jgi:hypothetical protein
MCKLLLVAPLSVRLKVDSAVFQELPEKARNQGLQAVADEGRYGTRRAVFRLH